MIIFGAVMFFLVLCYIKAYLMEMEKQDALLVNQTLSSNTSLYLSAEVDSILKAVENYGNLTKQKGQGETLPEIAKIKPDWSIILGQYSFVKDENLEQFLIAAGAPFYIRSIIMSAKPTILVERIPFDDYYYDNDFDHYIDEEYKDFVDEDDVYQIHVTSTTMFSTDIEIFRPGYSFWKVTRDRINSKKTFVFVKPTVIVQYVVKPEYTSNFIYSFSAEGFELTLKNMKTGVTAKRYFKRDDYR